MIDVLSALRGRVGKIGGWEMLWPPKPPTTFTHKQITRSQLRPVLSRFPVFNTNQTVQDKTPKEIDCAMTIILPSGGNYDQNSAIRNLPILMVVGAHKVIP